MEKLAKFQVYLPYDNNIHAQQTLAHAGVPLFFAVAERESQTFKKTLRGRRLLEAEPVSPLSSTHPHPFPLATAQADGAKCQSHFPAPTPWLLHLGGHAGKRGGR